MICPLDDRLSGVRQQLIQALNSRGKVNQPHKSETYPQTHFQQFLMLCFLSLQEAPTLLLGLS